MNLFCKWSALTFCCLIQLQYAEVQQGGACRLVGMFPFTQVLPPEVIQETLDSWKPDVLSWTSFSYIAATMLAMDHFNARDPSVVPELANLLQGCNVSFPSLKVIDSLKNIRATVQALVWDATTSDQGLPCAVLGPALFDPAMSVQSVTDALGIPQIVYFTETDLLYRPEIRNTIGTVSSVAGRSRAMAEYLKAVLQTDTVAILYELPPASMPLATNLRDYSGPANGILVEALLDAGPPSGITMRQHQTDVIRELKDTGIKTIFINTLRHENIAGLAEALQKAGMLSKEYVYILAPHLVPTDAIAQTFGPQQPDSAVYQLLSGAMVFDTMDLFRVRQDDKFLAAWKNLNATFVDRCNSLIPLEPDNPYYYQAGNDFFQQRPPANFASLVYDAVVLVGMGMCQEKSANANTSQPLPIVASDGHQHHGTDGGSNRPPQRRQTEIHGQRKRSLQGPPPPSGLGSLNPDVQAMTNSVFSGASGVVSFRPGERTRNADDLTMGLYNIRPSEIEDDSGSRVFQAVLTSLWTKETGWENVAGTSFVYSDGTSNRPNTNRVVDNNYLAPWVRAVGLVLFLSASSLGIACIFAVYLLRNDAVVRQSQPIFMHLLCLGSVIMSLAILSLSFDEGAGWTHRQLDVACTATPWFFFLGQMMTFAALFTKLRRTDKVLQFRRRAVTVKSMMGPLVAMLMITLAILITWTIVDPWTWERIWISEVPAETYGKCTSDHFWAFFGSLMGLLIVSEAATVFYAWKTSDICESFSDTTSVMQAICTHLQAWVVGVPILTVLQNSSADATYFGRVLLIWTFAVSSVGVVVGPKIFSAIVLRRNPQLRSTKARRVSVTGVGLRSSIVRLSSDGDTDYILPSIPNFISEALSNEGPENAAPLEVPAVQVMEVKDDCDEDGKCDA